MCEFPTHQLSIEVVVSSVQEPGLIGIFRAHSLDFAARNGSVLNVPGYHWHFLSDDHTVGGHVLACTFQGNSLSYDECTTLIIHIPQSAEFDSFDTRGISERSRPNRTSTNSK